MDFALTGEQELLLTTVRSFVNKECPREYIRMLDEREEYPVDLLKKMVDLGWVGLPFPEEYGGSGGNILDMILVLEELARGAFPAASALASCWMFAGFPIMIAGKEEQRKYYIPKLIRGELKFAFSLTEPNAGSDAAAISTRAEPKGDKFTINGTKMFCSSAHVADKILLVARTDKSVSAPKGTTIFLVDTKAPGLQMRRIPTLGRRFSGTFELVLEEVEVGAKDILGELNKGWPSLMQFLTVERICSAALSTGCAKAAVDDASQYARERYQFGRPISKFQVIQHKIVDMQIAVDSARMLTYRAAWLAKEGRKCTKEASMAKAAAAQAWMLASMEGLQIMGGYGYTMEYDMQRYFRDAKFASIGGGTAEIQRNIVARELGL
ncbi:MAG: acyl-CoA dehydrogenase [Clostridia bacterium]|nr:MAG: acyl-CoA dehydrogenase [Clostridia bacterium]